MFDQPATVRSEPIPTNRGFGERTPDLNGSDSPFTAEVPECFSPGWDIIHAMRDGGRQAVQTLFLGLVLFLGLLVITTMGNASRVFAPPAPPGIALVDMPAPLLAMGLLLALFPLGALLFTLLGIYRMMNRMPAVGPRLVWSLGGRDVTPLFFVGLWFVLYIALFASTGVIAFLAYTGNPGLDPIAGDLSIAGSEMPIVLGLILMLGSARALEALASDAEARLLSIAIILAPALATLQILADGIATGLYGPAPVAWRSVPSFLQWATIIAPAGGCLIVAVLAFVARRESKREARPTSVPSPA
jgi:hypothetical protein